MHVIQYSWSENLTFTQFIYLFSPNLNSQIKATSLNELLLNLPQAV